MPNFTIESTYRLPVFRHRSYEAPTLEAACQLAMADDDWHGQKHDHESAGSTYLTGAWPGIDTAYAVAALPVPPCFAQESASSDASSNDRPVPAPMMPRCRHCGSRRISRDANPCWDEDAQAWVLLATYDSQTCERCGADSNHLVEWVPLAAPGSTGAFIWDVIEERQVPKLAHDTEFQIFCRDNQNNLTVEQAAVGWRNRAPG